MSLKSIIEHSVEFVTAKLHNGISVEKPYRLENYKETLKMCFGGGQREDP